MQTAQTCILEYYNYIPLMTPWSPGNPAAKWMWFLFIRLNPLMHGKVEGMVHASEEDSDIQNQPDP